jgi:prepilin-type N-terminal cleavage/methylation domain-containing protein
MKNKGFTLIELLIVVSLIIIVVGVTGDIVISLVRSYNKTQITNEVEQNGNFAITKLEKELRNSSQVVSPPPSSDLNTRRSDSIEFVRSLSGGGSETITYAFVEADDLFGDAEADVYVLTRAVDSGSPVALTNYSSPSGVTTIDGLNMSAFENISDTSGSGPTVIKILLSVRQVGNPAVQFTQTTTLESTVVLRGSY